MTSMPTTDRFTFENRRLAEWLLQMVNEDAALRKAAAKVIKTRFFVSEKLLMEGHAVEDLQSEFSAAVCAAVNEPGFPAIDFVRNLLALDMALHESWREKAQEDRARDEEGNREDLAKMGENPTVADKRRYVRRTWVRCLRECKRIGDEEPHEVITTGTAVTWIIQALGLELLPASDLLLEMLFTKHKAHLASAAIARMGRSGLVFYDDLVRGLKQDDANFYCARALGALLTDAPERIPEILHFACHSTGTEQIAAINAFSYGGKQITSACPEVETRLLELLQAGPEDGIWYATVNALGCCGRRPETVDALLTRLNSGDNDEKGVLIQALGDLGIEPEKVVPRLIEMLDAFEEYDPDWEYYGECGRVVHALRQFGKAATPAVPALIRHIWTKAQKYWSDGQELATRPEPDTGIIGLLGELGASAKEALPTLVELSEEMRRRNREKGVAETNVSSSGDAPPGPTNDEDTCWNIAIKRIRAV